jgi:hypothetical protein
MIRSQHPATSRDSTPLGTAVPADSCRMLEISAHRDADRRSRHAECLQVPENCVTYATWAYSSIKPPSRSRRRTRILASCPGICARPAGGFCRMRPVGVVMAGVLAQDQSQVPFSSDQHPVQALAASAGHPAFRDRVRARRPDRRLDDPRFTSVGYGAQSVTIDQGPTLPLHRYQVRGYGRAGRAEPELAAHLDEPRARRSRHLLRGFGGTELPRRGAGETNIVAGTTITGDFMCWATNVDYRMDTPSVRAFLGQ